MKPINTALCAFGMSGYVFHAPFIDVHPGFNLYGVWERTKNNAQARYPHIKTFRNLEVMLADEDIELVIVNTPSVTHYDLTKQALLSGKHVIVEKPFTATVAEAEELILLANEKNVVLSVYHNRRYDSDFRTVKKILDEGCLSPIVEAEFHYDRYDPELSYKAHKETPTAAVGSLYDLGAHLIDQALVLFGMPKAVYADVDTFRPNSKVSDYFDVKLIYDSHRVILKSSYYVRENISGNILHGKKGSFIKSKSDVQEAALLAGKVPGTKDWGTEPDTAQGVLHTEKDGEIIRQHIPTLKGDYMLFFEGIYQAIRNQKAVPVSAEDGARVIKIIEAALQSHQQKVVVNLQDNKS